MSRGTHILKKKSVSCARIQFEYASLVLTTLFLYVKDQKRSANSHLILVVINNDGTLFKSSGSTTRSSTRWNFSYFVCPCSCGSDEYSCLYRCCYQHLIFFSTKTSLFSSLLRNQYRNGCFVYGVYLSDWGFLGKTHVGHFLGMGCSFNLCIHIIDDLPGRTVFSFLSNRLLFQSVLAPSIYQ